MTDLTTTHTSTCITTSVDLLTCQSFLGFVLRVVAPTGCTTLPLQMLVESSGLRRTFKVCFSILRLFPRTLSVRNTLTTTGSKASVTVTNILPIYDWLMSLRSRLRHRTITLILVGIRTIKSQRNNCRRAP